MLSFASPAAPRRYGRLRQSNYEKGAATVNVAIMRLFFDSATQALCLI